MKDLELEYRMYGLVPYNISPIQQAIQFGHAVVEYSLDVKTAPTYHQKLYQKWGREDKTFIILNGGTTNESPMKEGTLQQHLRTLNLNGILTSSFREPDLNDTLTAVVFLVDERVFNREKYPDFVEDEFRLNFKKDSYDTWFKNIGGERNAFLRTFLPTFKKA